MAFEPQDIERMIMQAHYKEAVTQPPSCDDDMSDMEREQYRQQIRELIGAVETLLDANRSIGEQLNDATTKLDDATIKLDEANSAIGALQDYVATLESKIKKLEGKDASNNRIRFAKRGDKVAKPEPDKGKIKEQRESDYIENEGKIEEDQTDADDDNESESTGTQAETSGPRDLSNRPDHYETMHADICVVHECDIDKLAEMGLEFLRYTRPQDQIDTISVIRQDRYLYAWVRDMNGKEFPFFIPKAEDSKTRACTFVNEADYDYPKSVPHTSVTAKGLAGFATRRFQYGITTGSEMYHMQNEKLKISKQTILNWLKQGGEFISGILPFVKRKLLTPNTVIYCDETWVDVKVKCKDGKFHYMKRYMWVIVNLTTNMCYYLYGSRKRSVIEEFLQGFKGTLMTDAYAAYAYFNQIEDCIHVCCWAHARRIFVYALNDYKDQLAQMFIDLIGHLYKIETEHILLHRTEEEIVKARKLEAIPILHSLRQNAKEFLEKFDKKKMSFSSKLHQALSYMLNNWDQLISYVNVGNVLIDNNAAERAIRPFTNLRKSFGGFSSEDGARTASRYLTLVETCKLIKKAPQEVFRNFFDMIVAGRRDYENMSLDLLCVK